MALVPVSPGPDVAARPPSVSYQQGADSALPFGAGEGAGLAALGTSMEQGGDVANKIGSDLAIQADIRATKDASTQSMMYANNLGFKGDGTDQNPNGFFAMRGQQAIDYAPKYLDAIKAQGEQQAAGMTERQRNMFQSTMEQHLVTQSATAQRFVMQQNIEANKLSSDARISAATGAAMNQYNDPVALEQGAKIVRGEVASRPELQGTDAATLQSLQAETQKALGKYYGDMIQTAEAKGDVTTAVGLFNRFSPEMDPTSRIALGNHLRTPMQNAEANAAANRYLGLNTTVGDGTSMPSQDGVISPGGTGPRGMRNNNPLNLEYRDGQGASRSDGRFGVYPTMEDGIAANAKQLVRYQDVHGLNTVNGIIGRWSPASDPGNPSGSTAAYAASVAKSMGVGPDDKIDLHNTSTMGSLITGMSKVENGGRVPEPGAVQRGVSQAFPGAAVIPISGPSNAVEQASSPEANKQLAAATQVHPDFAGARQQAQADYGQDAEMFPKVMSAISRQESVYTKGVKEEKISISKAFNDNFTALTDGSDKVNVGDLEIKIRHAFDPATADDMMGKLHEAAEFGQTYKTAQTMTPEMYAQRRSELVASLTGTQLPAKNGKNVVGDDGTTPSPDAGVTGYAQRKKELGLLDATYAKAQADLKADPASYVRSTNPDVQQAFQAGTDPGSVASAIEKSMSTQRSLGMQEPRAISNAAAAQRAHELNSIPPDKGDLGASLDAMQKQYGTAWPAVWKDIVRAGASPQFQALAAMSTTEQTAARGDLTRALQDKAVKGEEFGKSLDPIEKTAAEQQIQVNMKPLQGVLPAYNSNSAYTSVIMPAVQTLATHYMTQGMDGVSAANKAYNGVIGAKYDIDGMLMVPKAVGLNKVLAAGQAVTAGLKDEDLQGTTAAEARAGTWASMPDGSGAGLLKKTLQGNYMPIRRQDGSYVTIPYSDVPRLASNARASAADFVPGPGL